MRPSPTLVLTAAPESGAVTDAVTRTALEALKGAAADAQWLSPGDAWEVHLDLPETETLAAQRDAVAQALGSMPVDINIVAGPPDHRRKRLLCADMESTIIRQELIDEIADLVGQCRHQLGKMWGRKKRRDIFKRHSLLWVVRDIDNQLSQLGIKFGRISFCHPPEPRVSL